MTSTTWTRATCSRPRGRVRGGGPWRSCASAPSPWRRATARPWTAARTGLGLCPIWRSTARRIRSFARACCWTRSLPRSSSLPRGTRARASSQWSAARNSAGPASDFWRAVRAATATAARPRGPRAVSRRACTFAPSTSLSRARASRLRRKSSAPRRTRSRCSRPS
ncbi:hypothetical protein M885DRAFT_547804 [Pelagophyceae sp. CCMP2097]|nr:hypothetical protein M885DRAFT_547804 [Pelagophyceae sp. CCMP2097]